VLTFGAVIRISSTEKVADGGVVRGGGAKGGEAMTEGVRGVGRWRGRGCGREEAPAAAAAMGRRVRVRGGEPGRIQ
jgi:hypothetical protein